MGTLDQELGKSAGMCYVCNNFTPLTKWRCLCFKSLHSPLTGTMIGYLFEPVMCAIASEYIPAQLIRYFALTR